MVKDKEHWGAAFANSPWDTSLGISGSEEAGLAGRRKGSYVILAALLLLAFVGLRQVDWQGSSELHTIMEVVATLLATTVGTMALVRHYTLKNNTFLLIGAGFLGTAFLDGYHAVVTSSFFAENFPSGLASLIPWSWVASRWFLSVLLFLSWLAWRFERHAKGQWTISEAKVYWSVAILTLASFYFFAFVPLPPAYYPELFFHRPEEFVPAFFFLAALAGYLHKGAWKHDSFEYWLVLSLIVGFLGQAAFMSLSGTLFDTMFDAAHLLKKLSYILVQVGLMVSMFQMLGRLEGSESHLRTLIANMVDGIITIDDNGTIKSINPAGVELFGYAQAELVGRNVKILMPEPYAKEHDGYLDNYKRTTVKKIIGMGREVEGLRKDGSVFPMDLAVGEFTYAGRRHFIGTVRDITERKEIDRMKNEFISTVSHELRSPLTSIGGSLSLLMGGVGGGMGDKARSLIKIAKDNTDRLVRLINDILDTEKIAAGKMKFVMAPHEISDLVTQAVESCASLAAGRNIKVHLDAPLAAGQALVDTDRFAQIMANLLSNAIKFSPQGADVRVALAARDGEFRVSIADQGPGIPEDFQGRIFEKFAQADGSNTRTQGGTGLGLAISRSIVEHMGGKITFESESGKGACFHFSLPQWGADGPSGSSPTAPAEEGNE